MTSRTIIISTLSVFALSACAITGETETRVLKERAIADARQAPRIVHLAYLQCYALPQFRKSRCRRSIKELPEQRQKARNWEYIHPYDYEMERQGFIAFLRDHDKACAGVEERVRYSKKLKAYVVNCTDGHSYPMRFDEKSEKWILGEGHQ